MGTAGKSLQKSLETIVTQSAKEESLETFFTCYMDVLQREGLIDSCLWRSINRQTIRYVSKS